MMHVVTPVHPERENQSRDRGGDITIAQKEGATVLASTKVIMGVVAGHRSPGEGCENGTIHKVDQLVACISSLDYFHIHQKCPCQIGFEKHKGHELLGCCRCQRESWSHCRRQGKCGWGFDMVKGVAKVWSCGKVKGTIG